jgi:hypothetical protein
MLRLRQILRAPSEGDLIIAGRQIDMLTVSAVNLGMKEEIWKLVGSSVAAGRQRIEANQALGSDFVFPIKFSFLPIAPIRHRQAVVSGAVPS